MYERASFSVPASAGSRDYCEEHGHTLPDRRGRCLRCGDPTSVAEYQLRMEADDARHTAEMRAIVAGLSCMDPQPPEAA